MTAYEVVALVAFLSGFIVATAPRWWKRWRRREQRRNDAIQVALGNGLGIAASFVKAAEPAFIECDSCREKSGSPTLCRGCFMNRSTINQLIQDCD